MARLETAGEWKRKIDSDPQNQPLEASRAEEAAAAFQASLKAVLNNGWAIDGLMEAQKKLGDEAGAKARATAAYPSSAVGVREVPRGRPRAMGGLAGTGV